MHDATSRRARGYLDRSLSSSDRPSPQMETRTPVSSIVAMVKLASARESRTYGAGRRARSRWEYINAGVYVLGTVLLAGGFAAQLSPLPDLDARSGLAVAFIGLLVVLAVNAHDLAAQLAGVDYCLAMVEFDPQLALVEFTVPLMNMAGVILTIVGVLLVAIQMEKGYSKTLENQALNTLIAGPAFWLIGSIHNICQIYERASGHVQVLQNCVQVPLLVGSLLFLVAGIINRVDAFGTIHSSSKTLGKGWILMCLSGSVLFFVGGVFNVLKVFKMQQIDGVRLEKLRGCAYERLGMDSEGQLPMIMEASRRKEPDAEKGKRPGSFISRSTDTPYKDALLNRI